MCRNNQLLGGMLMAFGLGLLMGKCLEAGFMSTFFGLAIVVGGVEVMRQKLLVYTCAQTNRLIRDNRDKE